MTLKQVAAFFVQTSSDGLPVLGKDSELLGEITGKELISIGLPKYINMFGDLNFLTSLEPFEEYFKREETMKAREVYNSHVFSVSETSSIVEAAFIMVTKNRRRIYVVREGKLVGTIHRMDFISKVLQV
jgi:CBS domain-containing protein